MTDRSITLLVLITLLCSGCSNDTAWAPNPPSHITAGFVSNQDLPLFHYTHQIATGGAVEFFRSSYGHGQDCPSGCFYSTAYGVRVSDKIGWFAFDDYEGYAAEANSYFDIQESDSLLFVFSSWLICLREEPNTCRHLFFPYLADDPDTSIEALTSLAGLLHTYYSLRIAENLIDNHSVRDQISILYILAALPSDRYPQYESIRVRAQALIDEME